MLRLSLGFQEQQPFFADSVRSNTMFCGNKLIPDTFPGSETTFSETASVEYQLDNKYVIPNVSDLAMNSAVISVSMQ